MQYSTLPFTLANSDQPYLIDVGVLYAQAQTLTDQRKARGRRYSLALIITIAVLAKLAGYSRVEAVADWAKLRQNELHLWFGTKHPRMPHHTTWSRSLGWAVSVGDIERVAQAALAPPPNGDVPERCSRALC